MLSLQLETCVDLDDSNPTGLSNRLKRLVSLSKESLLEVRHYIFDLKPYLAGEKGLSSMVESQIREFRNVAGVATELEVNGQESEVAMPVSTCLYRVTQEALANVFKHAQAFRLDVTLEYGTVDVSLTIRAKGRESESGQGTRVEIRLPAKTQVPASP